MGKAEVHIEGLRETARAFKQMPRDLKRELPKGLQGVAEVVAKDARARVPVFVGANPRNTPGKARASIIARAAAQSATIVGGKGSVPYYGWLDFGSRNPRTGNNRAEGPWRGSGAGPQGGRFIYPAIEANRDRIQRAALEAIAEAERKAGF